MTANLKVCATSAAQYPSAVHTHEHVGRAFLRVFVADLDPPRVSSSSSLSKLPNFGQCSSASATSDNYGSYGDRDRGLDLPPIENYGDDGLTGLEFSINPERVAPILRRLISPTKTRARIYDRNGYLILDSRNLYIPGEVMRLDLPPPNEKKPNFFKRGWNAVKHAFTRLLYRSGKYGRRRQFRWAILRTTSVA